MEVKNKDNNPNIEAMFKAGAHYAFARSKRHPTTAPYIFGVKNRVEIFNLEETDILLNKALEFVKAIAATGKHILFVGGKSESQEAIRKGALTLGLPHVAGRWIGGTLTNFGEIRRRIEKFERLTVEREKGELTKYTKKERLLIDREIANLDRFFGGLVLMKEKPAALFVIDPRKEKIAVKEAEDCGIPVIALAGSDCNLKDVDFPIVANDASRASIEFFVQKIVAAYKAGKQA
ncbi:MAG TPA: 30S ribosomal protein S2 [Candidatus Paceibacterota bacterium]